MCLDESVAQRKPISLFSEKWLRQNDWGRLLGMVRGAKVREDRLLFAEVVERHIGDGRVYCFQRQACETVK